MEIRHNVSLKPYNTFGLDVMANAMAIIGKRSDLDDLPGLLTESGSSLLVLGGGSNILFTKNVEGLVLKVETSGILTVEEDKHSVLVRVEAGVEWHDLVDHCVDQDWGGIENLALIPGKAGAGPIQNIGAYGVELKDVFYELEAFEIATGNISIFSAKDCNFGYRDSYFKREGKNRFLILSITLRLSIDPEVKLDYGAVKDEVKRLNPHRPTIRDVRDAIVNIRRNKLPDPAFLGNAGSFFKNPSINDTQFLSLKAEFPGLVTYPTGQGSHKLAAGWLIEQCGWKGKRRGDAGVHDKQSLVLVNYGNATGIQILELADEIKLSVKDRFGVVLETEVNIM